MTRRRDGLLHPIPQMTTYELTDLRQALEERLAGPVLPPGSLPREELQHQLAEVTAEQVERARIRRGGHHA